MSTPSAAPQGPLLRALASSSTARRRAALAQLRTYLSSARQFSLSDMLKLWKALFYCLYMTPRPRNQQRRSGEISELAECFESDDNLALFLEAFWVTIAREWEGIDKVRLDKFLFLIRRMVGVTLGTCRVEEEIDEMRLERHIAVLGKEALAPRENKIPNGLRLHVLDVLVYELVKVDPEASMDVKTVLAPVEKLRKDSLAKSVRERAKEVLEDERVTGWGQAKEQEAEE